MKKNKILRKLIAMILVLLSLVAVTAAAAEYAADDGMTFQIITTKREYGVNEEVQVILLAKNYNSNMKLANITWNATVPGGELTFLSGELTGKQTVEVGERAAINLRLMKIVEIPEEQPPATQPAPTTPAGGEEGPSVGSIIVLVLLILLVLAGIGGIVYLILKNKGIISCIALLLSLGMLLPCIPAVDVSAAGENLGDMILGDDNVLNASVKFVVDGVEYEATATMTYEMADQTETVVEAMHSSMSNLVWSEYSMPAITPTIGEHPRVMFTTADIPRIVKNLEAPENAELASEFYRLLGLTFNGSFGALASENSNTNFSSDKLDSLRIKAMYYALFKNSEDSKDAHMAEYYGKIAVRGIQTAMKTIIFAPGYDETTRGQFQLAAAEVYDWCYDLLTYEDKQNIAALIQDIGAASEAGWPIEVGPAVVSHTAGNLVQSWWGAVAIAMYDEYPTFYEQIYGMYFDVFVEPRNAWYVSETHHQGNSYGVAGRYDGDLTAQALLFAMTGGFNDRDNNGETDGYMSLDPIAGRASYQLLYSLRPDGQMLREGDTWEENQTRLNELWDAGAPTASKVAFMYKDGLMKRLAFELSNLKFKSTDMMHSLILSDSESKAQTYYNLPYTKYFPAPSASMIARTGWDMGTASNDVLVKMQMAPVFVNNHQHREAGAFQIYYKGILASESGYYVLYGTNHDLYYNKASIAHNTLSITSKLNRYGTQTYAADTSWGHKGHTDLVTNVIGEEFGPNIYKPEYSYLAGDIAGAYQSVADDNVQEAIRSMLFLNLELDGNTENPGAFIVFDQIKTEQIGSKKSFLLHTQSEPEIDDNVVIVKNTKGDYNGKLTNQVVYVGTAEKADKNYTITKIGGPGKEFVIGSYNYAHTNSIEGNLSQEQGWGRVEITTETTDYEQTDYLLNVMYVGDADSDAKTIPAKLIYDGKGVIMGAQLMNHVAMFNMDGNNRISKDVSFTIPANEGYSTFKVNVAGLKAGTWTIYVNGESVGSQVASEDGGMIYFEATAGTVKLVCSIAESTKVFDQTPNTDVEPIGLMVNNFFYYTEEHPVLSGDDYLIPLCLTFKALSGNGSWNREGTKFTVVYSGSTYEFAKDALLVDGKKVEAKQIKVSGGDLLVDISTVKNLIAGDASVYYDQNINRIRVDVAGRAAIPRLPEDILFEYPTAVQVESVVDLGYSTLSMENCLDGDPTTRWCTQESGNNVSEGVFDFGKIVPLTDILIMFWTEDNLYSDYIFDILVSTDDSEYTPLFERQRSGEINPKTFAQNYVRYDANVEARYVKIVGHGRYRYVNSGKPNMTPDNSWFMPSEIIFLQKSVIDPDEALIAGGKLLAEAECFHSNNETTTLANNSASGKESVIFKKAHTNNPGAAASAKPQLWATFIPSKTGIHSIWARVNASNVKNGENLWVHIDGITGDRYYAEKVNVGKVDKGGFVWIKLGETEEQIASAIWQKDQEYKLSVISGCEDLEIDCFMLSSVPSYVPYDDCHSVTTSVAGDVSVNGSDAIYEHSMAQAAGTAANLQKVSADGSVSQKYIDYVLTTDNLPGDISLNIITNASGIFTIEAKVKVSDLKNDKFFCAISANDDDYSYQLIDLSDMGIHVSTSSHATIQLGQIEIQAAESIYVRIRSCTPGVTIGMISTTCQLPDDVNQMQNGKVTLQAEDATLGKAGEETIIVTNNDYYGGELVKIVANNAASNGKAVEMVRGYTNYSQMIKVTTEANPYISFRVTPDKSGEYYIWAKVYAPKNSALYCYIDGGDDYYYWRQPLTAESYSVDDGHYVWVRLYQECQKEYKLNKEHIYNWVARRIYTISFRAYTAGVQVDEIYITDDPNYNPHNHTFSEKWSTTETQHWREPTCKDTAFVADLAEHDYDNIVDTTCNTCGYERPPHKCSNTIWGYDLKNHWNKCICGQEFPDTAAAHSFVSGYCTQCGIGQPQQIPDYGLTIQAENAKLNLDVDNANKNATMTDGRAPLKIIENAFASGGKVVRTMGYYPSTAYSEWTLEYPGHIELTVTPQITGTYYIWAKVLTPMSTTTTRLLIDSDTLADGSVYARQEIGSPALGSTDWANAEQGKAQHFVWVKLGEAYRWSKDQAYVIRIRSSSTSVMFDEFVITGDADFAPHNHTFQDRWSSNETQHWHDASCGDTSFVADKADHVYDNLKDTTCNTCRYVRPAHVCNFSIWGYDSTNHWRKCVCGDRAPSTVGAHTFADGLCSTCGISKPTQINGNTLIIQAEDAKLDIAVDPLNKSDTSTGDGSAPLKVINNAFASGGKVVQTLGCYPSTAFADWTSEYPGHIELTVTPQTTGTYYIWAKVLTPSSTTTVRLLVDDASNNQNMYTRYEIGKPNLGSLDWSDAASGNAQDFVWVKLGEGYQWTKDGAYVIRFRSSSINVMFDEFAITSDVDYVPHQHIYDDWSMDEHQHWREPLCDDTTLIRDRADHVFENVWDTTCDTCGYTRPAHTCRYNTLRRDETHHWRECSCGRTTDKEAHSYVNGVCQICGPTIIQAEDAALMLTADPLNKYNGTGDARVPVRVVNNIYAGGQKVVKTVGYYTKYATNSQDRVDYAAATAAPHICVTYTPTATGTYYIWAKAILIQNTGYLRYIEADPAEDGTAAPDSAYVYETQRVSVTGAETSDSFVWIRIGSENGYHWTAGESYNIQFRSATINIAFDEFLITADAGYVPHDHTYSSGWSFDENQHWHEPTCCDIKLVADRADHVFDNITDASCNTCGYLRAAHTHSYSGDWKYDGENHWRECVCGQRSETVPHDYTGPADTKCDTCGCVRAHVHTYSETWSKDQTHHWKEATCCSGVIDEKAQHSLNANMVCTVCMINLLDQKTIQAEDAVLMLTADPLNKYNGTGDARVPVRVVNNTYAGGQKVVKTVGYYTKYPTDSQDRVDYAAANVDPHICVTYTPTTTGTYYVWAKAILIQNTSYLRYIEADAPVDGTAAPDSAYVYEIQRVTTTGSETSDSFVWIRIGGQNGYHWTAGESYDIRLRSATINIAFDEFVVTNNPSYLP